MSQEDKRSEDKQKLPELAKEKAARVKQHVLDNKTTYLVGAGCLAGGIAVGLYFRRPIVIDFRPVINNTPVFNNHNTVENNLGRVSKIIRDAATGEEWQKIRYLAEKLATEHDISVASARNLLNRHVRGELETVFDKTYEIAGLRTNF